MSVLLILLDNLLAMTLDVRLQLGHWTSFTAMTLDVRLQL